MAIRGYDIGGMLARSGQAQGQQIASGFQQFGQGLGGLFSGVTRGLQKRQERKDQEAAAQEAQALLQQYANNPEQLNAMGQKYASEGNDPLAKLFFDASKAAVAKETSVQQRGVQGGLMAITQAASRGVPLEVLQEAQRSVIALGGTQAQIMEAYKAGQDRDTGEGQTFASAGRYKDKDNNIYTATEVRTKGGGVKIDYSPITPNAPENPVGELTPIGGAYSETAEERMGRGVESAAEETKAEEFSRSQQVAIDNLPKIEVAIGNSERSLDLLKQIKTGGFTTAIVRSAQQFFGVEPKNQAEFNLLAGKTVLDNLSNFPGAISEGERMYLERLYQSLERSGGANQAILENLLQEAQFMLADTQAKANASSYKDYLETRPTFSSVVSRDKGTKKVNFNDLKN